MFQNTRTNRWWLYCTVAAIAIAGLGPFSSGQAQQAGSGTDVLQVSGTANTFQVPLYKSRILQLRTPVTQVSVGNPEIADILIFQAQQVYVVGKNLGTTNVVLWDRNNRVVAAVDVEVTHDLASLKQKLHELLPNENIQVRSSNGIIALSGEISSIAKMDTALKLAASFAPRDEKDKEAKVLNMMQVGGAQQVLLEVKVAEMRRDITKRMGINFNAIVAGSPLKIGAVSGGARFPDALFEPDDLRIPVFGGKTPIGPVIDEFVPNDLSIADKGLFASFLSGDVLFNAVIDAAKNNGLAKILSEPTLTTLTGQTATFLSGGEFPIPVPGEDGQVTISFKEFGVGLEFLPVVLDSGRINLKVNIAVSELSAANSVVVGVAQTQNVFAVPALTKRSSSSTLELSDGQTMAIAGLISDNVREAVDKFPGLGDVPMLGMLFRSQQFIKDQTELVIFVTPRFAKPTPPELVRLPTDSFVEPSDLEFYLMGRMESARPRAVQPTETLQKGGLEGAFGHQL